jgi:hypothetical protein
MGRIGRNKGPVRSANLPYYNNSTNSLSMVSLLWCARQRFRRLADFPCLTMGHAHWSSQILHR